MSNPFDVVRQFEQAVADYTGAPCVVAVNSCTMALLLSLIWCKEHADKPTNAVNIPKRTYLSVPMCIKHAGFRYVHFRDNDWIGMYRLYPFPLWDCARFFSSGMYSPGSMMCVSFHVSKILGDSQGGAILLDDPIAAAWLRRMRFDGRTEGLEPKYDEITELGYHCYLSPDVAARLLHRLKFLPKHNEPLPNSDYPDLSQIEIFK